MGHERLIQCCIEVLDDYVPESVAIETHVNKYLKHKKDLNEDDQTFILEVFSECVRYSGILGVVLNGFFNRDGKNILRSEGSLYRVFAYLALFRLDELGIAHYRNFVWTQDVNKMYKFLRFLFDDKNLLTWMKDEWNKLYEYTFVQSTLLSPILAWLPELHGLLDMMKKKIDNKLKPKKVTIPLTELKPFNITQPRPRSIPIPQPIPKLQKRNPVPTYINEEPKEQKVMETIREINRRRAEERLMEASRMQFACANPEKSEKTKQKMQEIIAEQEASLDFERHNAHPVPHGILKDNIAVKLNAAAILREGKLYKEREKHEIEKIEKLEAGARDASEFLEWQTKMKKMDFDGQMAEIERRRLEGKLSLEEAILARQELIAENHKKVENMKKEADKLMQEYLEKRMEQEQEMRKRVEDVLDTHENAKEAKRKLQQYKASIVQKVNEESKELMKQALEEAAREMQQRMDLIRQIRAMEAVPVIHEKLVDFTAAAGYGLLSEMSIAELRERINIMKVAQQEEEDMKRDEILAMKQEKDRNLMDTLETISRHRTEQSKAAAIRLEERKKSRHTKPVLNDPKLDELQRKLEEKREMRKQLQEQTRVTPSKKSTHRLRELSASKKVLEESRWQELEQRRQRLAKLAGNEYSKESTQSALTSKAALVT